MTAAQHLRSAFSLRLSVGLLLLSLMATGPSAVVSAQTQQESLFEIRSGAVYVDGERLPDAALPEGLDLDGIEAAVHFGGPVTPVFELNGTIYVLQGRRIVHLADVEAGDGAQVYGFTQVNAPVGQLESARRASERAYMESLSERDRSLYVLLQRERLMDEEILRLAQSHLVAGSDRDRQRIRDELRDVLDEAFVLKISIREAEIDQAQEQLEAAREQLNRRTANREEIVSERLRELTGSR